MSQEQRNQIGQLVNWILKIGVALLFYLSVTVFMDIRDDIKQLSNDVSSIKDRLIRVEMRLDSKEKK